MGRHTQLERPRALEDPPAAPAGPATAPARRAADDRPTPPSWGATARAVLPAFVLTRLVTLVAGVVGAAIWGIHDASAVYDPGGLTSGLGAIPDRLVAPYARWDAVWFLDIANQTYPTSYEPRTAFFPLYPALLRAGGLVLGSPVIAGLLISSACAYVGAMLVHRLTELELGRPAAGMAVWALLLFPGSLWLSAVYSEGLFLLLSAGCLYYARERRWAVVAVLGALAATTRSAGVVLVVPILVMAWQGRREGRDPGAATGPSTGAGGAPDAGRAEGVRRWRAAFSRFADDPDAAFDRFRGRLALELRPAALARLRDPGLAAAAVVGGLLLFVVGLRLAGHSWTVSFDQQQAWGRRNVGPIEGVSSAITAAGDGLSQIFGSAPTALITTPNAEWMNPLLLAFLLVGLAALVGAARRLPPAYAAYAGAALLLPLSAPAIEGGEPLMSLPRFLGVLFPLAMWTGWWLTRGRWQRTRRVVLGVVGLGLLALFSELTARWLFVA
jgi:hypothetical protein